MGDSRSEDSASDNANNYLNYEKNTTENVGDSFVPGGACSFPARVTSVKLFQKPRQRQRWGDKQILPHVNWGDLFFDLFYVAAAYNLSYIIVGSPTREGLLYLVGLFGPIMAHWFHRVTFDSRYALHDDPLHRSFEVLQLCFLATAVVHIRSFDVMSNSDEYPDMFAYSLGVCLLAVCSVYRSVEIAFFVDGEAAAKVSARKEVTRDALMSIFFLAAAVVSGTQFYSGRRERQSSSGTYANEHSNDGGENRALFVDGGIVSCSGLATMLARQCLSGGRHLAEASEYGYAENSSGSGTKADGTTNIPVWLCMGGWLFGVIYNLVAVVFFLPPGGEHKKSNVPMNIDFVIHRYGEWVMLLLGEGILSILITETSDSLHYYITFYCALISIILLQYLHFRSQPHHADGHAMRKSKNAGMFFSTVMQIYSIALVAVGVSYKMILLDYTYTDNGGSHRLLQLVKSAAIRFLAGSESPEYSQEERRQRVANFFCGSLAVTWICCELLLISHNGLRRSVERCECKITNKISKASVLLCLFRAALIIFIATLSLYITDPLLLTVIGLAAIITEVITRLLGDLIYPEVEKISADDDGGDSEDGHWPNVTHAKAEPADNEKEEHV